MSGQPTWLSVAGTHKGCPYEPPEIPKSLILLHLPPPVETSAPNMVMLKKATRQQTKTHNSRLVLKTIYDQDQISRAGVARATALSRATVSDVVTSLLEDGLVEEIGLGPSAGGKPPTLLDIVADARLLVCLDLANSHLRGGLVDLRGRIRHRLSLPLNDRDGETVLGQVYEMIDALTTATDRPLLGIGIGTPGLMDGRRGIVRSAINMDWTDLPLRDLLQDRYGLPVHVVNDSHAAVLAEYTFGLDDHRPNLVVIKIGRGISAGIVLNGKLLHGDGSGAGEIGHVRMVAEGGDLCRCGHHGCLETIVSSRAFIRKAQAIAQAHPDSVLNQLAPDPTQITTEIVLQAFLSGEPRLADLTEEAGHFLGLALASLVSTLNVQKILVAGTVAQFGDALLAPARETMQHWCLAALGAETQVELASLGTDIVILGAAALLLSSELGIV